MIIVSMYHPLELCPPVASLIRQLLELGENVAFIGGAYTKSTRALLDEIGIPYWLFERWPCVRFREHPFWRLWFEVTKKYRSSNLHCRILRWWLWRSVRKASRGNEDGIVLWSCNTLISSYFGDAALQYGKRHIQLITELGEELGKNRPGFDLQASYETSTLIQCEAMRAKIMAQDCHLPRVPFVLPNKPYGHPRSCCMEVSDAVAAQIVSKWKGKKVFLYQGSLLADRQGIADVLAWLAEAFPDAIVAIMSPRNVISETLKNRFSNVDVIPYIRPPHHLEVTSHATIGIAIYAGKTLPGISPLNALHCAPNKIFEYSGFGIPLLCNGVPGLKDSVGKASAAVCIDDLNRENVIAAARKLLENYDEYSANAVRFFESVDMKKLTKEILDFARRGE